MTKKQKLHWPLNRGMPRFCHALNSNGIVIGDNMLENMSNFSKLFCDKFRDKNGNIDESRRYIFCSLDLKYTQHEFDWQKYIKTMLKDTVTELPTGVLKINSLLRGAFLKDSPDERLGILADQVNSLGQNNSFLTNDAHITSVPTTVSIPKNKFYFDDNK